MLALAMHKPFTALAAWMRPFGTALRRGLSHRRMSRAAPIEEAARWRVIVDEAPVIELICDRRARISTAAGGALTLIGIEDAATLVGEDVSRIFPGVEFATGYEAALQGHANMLELEVAERSFSIRIEPLRGRDAVLGAFVFASDHSEKVRAQREAACARHDYKALFDESNEALYVCSIDGRLQLANDALVRLLGHESLAQLMAADLSRDFFGLRDDRARAIAEILAAGSVEGRAVRVKRRDGSVRQVLESCTLLRDADGEPSGIRGMLQDVTDVRRAARQRTDEERAEAAATLGAAAAHDFNNHLTIVAANLELLREDLEAGDREMHALRIMKAVRGARDVCERMTRLARPLECAPRSIDPGSFLLDHASAIEDLLGPAWSLEMRVPVVLPRIEADASLLSQALMNLCTNARDAMPEGGTVEVDLACPDAVRGEVVEIRVMDRGGGIPPELRRQLFRPFVSTKGPGRGSGLGLWIARRVTDLHGGVIEATPRPGGGTIFSIRLPTQDAAATRAASRSGIMRATAV